MDANHLNKMQLKKGPSTSKRVDPDPDEDPNKNYTICPNCFARIFEKNLKRHTGSQRCINYGNHMRLIINRGDFIQPLTNKNMFKYTMEENIRLKHELERLRHEHTNVVHSFKKLLGTVCPVDSPSDNAATHSNHLLCKSICDMTMETTYPTDKKTVKVFKITF